MPTWAFQSQIHAFLMPPPFMPKIHFSCPKEPSPKRCKSLFAAQQEVALHFLRKTMALCTSRKLFRASSTFIRFFSISPNVFSPVKNVTVIGAGIMGSAIAQVSRNFLLCKHANSKLAFSQKHVHLFSEGLFSKILCKIFTFSKIWKLHWIISLESLSYAKLYFTILDQISPWTTFYQALKAVTIFYRFCNTRSRLKPDTKWFLSIRRTRFWRKPSETSIKVFKEWPSGSFLTTLT